MIGCSPTILKVLDSIPKFCYISYRNIKKFGSWPLREKIPVTKEMILPKSSLFLEPVRITGVTYKNISDFQVAVPL